MADRAGQLGTEAKTIRYFRNPAMNDLFRRNGVESCVAFGCGQQSGVFAQEVPGFCALWIEIDNPALERPDRVADVENHFSTWSLPVFAFISMTTTFARMRMSFWPGQSPRRKYPSGKPIF